MNYKHGVMVQTIKLKPGIEDASADEVSQSLLPAWNSVVQKASKGLDILEGGNWEFVSHDLSRIGPHFIATFVIRRPK